MTHTGRRHLSCGGCSGARLAARRLLAAGATVAAMAVGPALAEGAVDPSDMSSVIEGYFDAIVDGTEVPSGWTGSVASCTAGTESAASRQATIDAVNYYRALVGLPAVQLDTVGSAGALEAALMMWAAGALSHHPEPSWPCYSSEGAAAAGTSNLYLGRSAASAVRGYMFDPGANNVPVGHRRWILFPQAVAFGTGSTGSSNALRVIGQRGSRPSVGLIAWPPAGFVPWDEVPERWSISNGEDPWADYSAATVSVTIGAVEVPVVVRPVSVGFGDNTLVFEPYGLTNYVGKPTTFSVTVSGIKPSDAAGATQHSYQVKAFPLAAPDDPSGLRVSGENETRTLRWRASREFNAPVTGYRVTLYGPRGLSAARVAPGALSFTSGRLAPGSYRATVAPTSRMRTPSRGTSVGFRVAPTWTTDRRVRFGSAGKVAVSFRLLRASHVTIELQRWNAPLRRWARVSVGRSQLRARGAVTAAVGPATAPGTYRVKLKVAPAGREVGYSYVRFTR